MENASKALLIAGEALIGIIILSIFAYIFQRMYTFTEDYKNNSERQNLVEFNTQYTKYITKTGDEPSYIYAEDVVTLAEQVVNWNKIATVDSEKIQLNILDKSGGIIYPKPSMPEFDRKEFLVNYKLKGDPREGNKEYKFSCKVEIDETSGRVNKIIIQVQGIRN